MPELPEVETVARSVNRRVQGRKIISVWLGSKPEPFRSAPPEIVRVLTGSTIVRARRVGKHIVADLIRDNEATGKRKTRNPETKRAQWIVHLGMTGQLLVCTPDAAARPHTHAVVQLDDNREIRFVDPRRFGRLAVLEIPKEKLSGQADGGERSGFLGPGREPLGISSDVFRALFRHRRTPIKSALLNQKLLHGVGNIYADESLFHAGIRPRRQAGRLTGRELDRLRSAIEAVLKEAIALGGSSVSDYVDADGKPGFFQFQHKVYMRTGQPCLVCRNPIQRIVLAGRGTHFCPNCQR